MGGLERAFAYILYYTSGWDPLRLSLHLAPSRSSHLSPHEASKGTLEEMRRGGETGREEESVLCILLFEMLMSTFRLVDWLCNNSTVCVVDVCEHLLFVFIVNYWESQLLEMALL